MIKNLSFSFFDNFHGAFGGGECYQTCLSCGGLCEHTLLATLFPGEAAYIAHRMCLSTNKFINKYVDFITTEKYKIELIRLITPCPFLDNEFKCIIKDFKPILCKIYPLYIKNCNGTCSIDIDSRCPLSQSPDISIKFLQKRKKIKYFLESVDAEWLKKLREYDEYYYDFSHIHLIREVPDNKVFVIPLKNILECRI
jgi:hypothetical protein